MENENSIKLLNKDEMRDVVCAWIDALDHTSYEKKNLDKIYKSMLHCALLMGYDKKELDDLTWMETLTDAYLNAKENAR